MKRNFVNGKKHGPYFFWYENGNKWEESNWVDGKRHGSRKSWCSDGSGMTESTYKNGIIEGEKIKYIYIKMIDPAQLSLIRNKHHEEYYGLRGDKSKYIHETYINGQKEGEVIYYYKNYEKHL